MVKISLFILTLTIGQIIFAQDINKKQQSEEFYFYYGMFGMGSNMGHLLPTLRIHNNKFVYTKEQNQPEGISSKKNEFVCEGMVPQSSIDSILLLVQTLKEKTIYRINQCVMSGGVIYIQIALGKDTTKFTLDNAFDSTALKIINIINPSLPNDKKLYGSQGDIKDEVECRLYLRNYPNKKDNDSANQYISEEAVRKNFEPIYNSLQVALKDSLAKGINNINDYNHVFTSSEKHLIDSLIRDFKQRTNIQIAVFTFDSLMASPDSVDLVTQTIGIENQINTTVGISIPNHLMHIWNDSLINNTVLYQYETKFIIDEYFIPFFKKGDLFKSTYEGVKELILKMNANKKDIEYLKKGN